MASIAVVDGIDVSTLRLFLAAVELGSVSKAAKRMRLTQPSATTKLHKLERQLGARLLERTPTGSTPTAAGERLAASCSDVIAAATSLVDRAEALHTERDTLTISATRHVADHFLLDWIATTDGLDADLRLLELDTLHAAQAVRRGEADLGLTEGPHAPLGLRSHVVAEERVVPVVGRSHRWFGRRRSLKAADLASTLILLGRRGSGTRDLVESVLAEHDWGREGGRVDVDGPSAARLGALNGSGVAFLPHCWVTNHLSDDTLSEIKLRDVEIVQQVRVVWRGAEPTTRPARRLVDALTG